MTNENQSLKSDFNGLSANKHSNYLSNISIAFPFLKIEIWIRISTL